MIDHPQAKQKFLKTGAELQELYSKGMQAGRMQILDKLREHNYINYTQYVMLMSRLIEFHYKRNTDVQLPEPPPS